MLKIGEKAPDFTLFDQNQNEFKLSDYAGKKVVLFFYSKDNTSGCTKQAIAFSELANEFADKNAVVVGISKDSVSSHEKFAQKHGLKLILASDPELDAIKKYDVWQEKKLYGKVSMGVVRSSYVIDENGIIIDAQTKVKPETNAEQVLCKL
ncbi:MAG: peroxiredoxin [Clostridiales bacterium]|nr:peroxiredoxin [Clostridiales bacterium]